LKDQIGFIGSGKNAGIATLFLSIPILHQARNAQYHSVIA